MEKEFVPFEFAFKLKELGFNEECMAVYIEEILNVSSPKNDFFHIAARNGTVFNENLSSNTSSAPLWQQAFDFMAFKHNIHGNVITTGKDKIYMSSEYREGYGGTKSNGGTYTDIYECRMDLLEDMIQLQKEQLNKK